MIVDFIIQYTKLIVSFPEDISVLSEEIDNMTNITICANSADVGKLIGKNGNMINALKTMINGCKAKNNKSFKLQVEAI